MLNHRRPYPSRCGIRVVSSEHAVRNGTLRFSIIIPTRNRPAALDRCLAAIWELNYPREDFEVLIADDGSDPPADAVVTHHASGGLPVVYIRCEGRGPARARNEALRRARAHYAAFTDDDCAPNSEWLTMFDQAYGESPNACLGGTVVDHPDNGVYGVASQLLVSFLYEDAEKNASGPRFFCSNNLAFPRDALIAMNEFDVNFPLATAEDRDLCARWASRDGDLQLIAGAVVRHRQQLGPLSFCRRHYRYGRGACTYWMRREAEDHHGNRLQSRAFHMRMLTRPFRCMAHGKALAVSALLAVSQAACAAGYLAECCAPVNVRRSL